MRRELAQRRANLVGALVLRERGPRRAASADPHDGPQGELADLVNRHVHVDARDRHAVDEERIADRLGVVIFNERARPVDDLFRLGPRERGDDARLREFAHTRCHPMVAASGLGFDHLLRDERAQQLGRFGIVELEILRQSLDADESPAQR